MDETKELWTRELNTEIQNASLLEDGSEVKARHINCINQMFRHNDLPEVFSDIGAEFRSARSRKSALFQNFFH